MTSSTPSWKIWVLAARPKTLSAAWVPVLVGTAAATTLAAEWSGVVLGCALVSSLVIQIATNLFNDAIDFKKGADTSARLGPTRVTASGSVSPGAVFVAAWICLAIAVLLGIPLVLRGGMPILGLGLVSLFLAYGYTGGPFPLAYLGLGDAFVYLFFGLIAVGGTYFLHTLSIEPIGAVLLAGSQIGLWATSLIAINNFRDSAEDLRNKKLTLAARFGARFSRIEISVLALLPFALGLAFWPPYGYLAAGLLPLFALPLAFRLVGRIWSWDPSPAYNELLALAGAIHAITGVLLAAGLLW
jgi:1,4-dihydroxy-2-naphthoate octaprenyltransferase